MRKKAMKYPMGGELGGDPKKDPTQPVNPKHWVFNDIKAATKGTLDGRSVKDIVLSAAKKGNIDPAFLYGSALVEGFNKTAINGNSISLAYENAGNGYSEFVDNGKVLKARQTQNKLDTKAFPVDGFSDYGLDTFGDKYDQLKKYLPEGFESRFQTYDAYNDATKPDPTDPTGKRRIADPHKIKTAAFKTNEDALIAKAAFLNYEKDSVNEYLKQKNINGIDERTLDYFTLAAYNGGLGGAKTIIDEYNSSNDKQNFINKGLTTKKFIHNNIFPRLDVQGTAKDLLGYKMGGKIVPKYQFGTGDPITGNTGPELSAGSVNVGVDVFKNSKNSPVPINPNAPKNEQIFALQPENQQGNIDNIVPLSQFYDNYKDAFGNTKLSGTGQYVNSNGQVNTVAQQQAFNDHISQKNYDNAMSKEKLMSDIERYGSAGITAINSYFDKKNAAQQARKNRRSAIMQEVDINVINPYANGTGSQAIFENGGKIHIKPENRGKFTAAAKRAGKSVQGYAAQILAHPGNYSPTLRKRANFARNAAKWHEDGGELEAQQGFQVIDGGKTKQLSDNVHSNPMMEFVGREHKEGGIGLQYGGNIAEVEDKEVGWVDNEGGLNIFGKLKLPGSNMTFRKAAKNIAEQENNIDKKLSLYTNTLNNGDPTDPYQSSAHTTAKVMFKSLDKQSKDLSEKKEALASYQNLILAMVQDGNKKMKYGGEMPERPQYEKGGEIDLEAALKAIAGHEGGKLGQKTSLKGSASGTYQMTSATVKSVWQSHFKDQYPSYDDFRKKFDSDANVEKEVAKAHLSDLVKDYGDYALAAWYSPAHAKRALNGDTKALDEIPGASSGNTQTFKQYLDDVTKRYEQASGSKLDFQTYAGKDNGGDGTRRRPPRKSGESDADYNKRVFYDEKAKDENGDLGAWINSSDSNNTTASKSSSLDYTPNYTPINSNGEVTSAKETPYGLAKRDATPFSDKVELQSGDKKRGWQSPLAIEQIAPELLTIATNRREPVEQLNYQPDLLQTFDISYQLGRNENQSTFNQAAQIAQQTGNVEALSELAAQKYKADESYNMQEVQGNAQQKLGVYGQNVATLNDAKIKNLALLADQQVKQTQAKFNTRKEDIAAFTSIAGKELQNKLENKTYNAYANLFKHYGFDKYGNVTFNPDDVAQKFTAGEAQQFGFMAAQQGANAIMGGDYNRQFHKVKNEDGSTTTTETLGRNKQIQDEYQTLKKQGFDDGLIGNMLRAKYPETISQD